MTLFDGSIIVFFIIAMAAGYLGGGFRELMNVICLVITVALFSFKSINGPIIMSVRPMLGDNLAYFILVLIFLGIYFLLKKIMYWATKGLLEHREGTVGKFNKLLGLAAGFFKALVVFFFFTYIIMIFWQHKFFYDAKQIVGGSYFFSLMKGVISFFAGS